MSNYSPGVILIWQIAAGEAKKSNATEIQPAHLLIGLCKFCDFNWEVFFKDSQNQDPNQRPDFENDRQSLQQRFEQSRLDPQVFRRRLRTLVAQPAPEHEIGETMPRSQASRAVFQRAKEIAQTEARETRSYHLLQALLELPTPLWEEILVEMGINNPLVLMFGDDLSQTLAEPANLNPLEPANPVPSPSTVELTPWLDNSESYWRDLTLLAAQGKLEPIFERREAILALARVLIHQRQRNALLVGDVGVGKTSIVKGLVGRLVGTNALPILNGKRIIEISLPQLLWGASNQAEINRIINLLINQASTADDFILFIEEIHTIFNSNQEINDAVKLLKSALLRGEINCIGTTTSKQYSQTLEQDADVKHWFQVIWINEPSDSEAEAILKIWRRQYQVNKQVTITDHAIEAAVEFSKLYLPDSRLPTKAIDILEQAYGAACLQSLTQNNNQGQVSKIERQDVVYVISKCINPEVESLDDRLRLEKLKEVFQQLFGQDKTEDLLNNFNIIIEEVSQSDISNIPTVEVKQDGERPQLSIRVREVVQGFIEDDPDIEGIIRQVRTVAVIELIKVLFPLSAVPIEIVRAWIQEKDKQNNNSSILR